MKQIFSRDNVRVYLEKSDPLDNTDRPGRRLPRIGLLNDALEDALGIQVLENELYSGTAGKPYIQWNARHRAYPCIHFNISHSENYIICAISKWEIGCDIQKIRNVPKNLHRYLNQMISILDMKQNIDWLDCKEQTKLWTQYESLGKCLGTGIPIPEQAFMETGSKKYKFEEINAIEGFHISICYLMDDEIRLEAVKRRNQNADL